MPLLRITSKPGALWGTPYPGYFGCRGAPLVTENLLWIRITPDITKWFPIDEAASFEFVTDDEAWEEVRQRVVPPPQQPTLPLF